MRRNRGVRGGPQKPLIILILVDPPSSRLAPVHMHTHTHKKQTHTPSVTPAHVYLPRSLAPLGYIQIPHRLGKRRARTEEERGEVTIALKHDSLQLTAFNRLFCLTKTFENLKLPSRHQMNFTHFVVTVNITIEVILLDSTLQEYRKAVAFKHLFSSPLQCPHIKFFFFVFFYHDSVSMKCL